MYIFAVTYKVFMDTLIITSRLIKFTYREKENFLFYRRRVIPSGTFNRFKLSLDFLALILHQVINSQKRMLTLRSGQYTLRGNDVL